MAATPGEGQFSFRVQWTDETSGLVKEFNLCYFEENGTVEMFDFKNRRTFLKRCLPLESVRLAQFAKGSVVTIMSRPLLVVGYLDEPTAARFKVTTTTTCCIIKPDVYNRAGEIVNAIHGAGLEVARCKLLALSEAEAGELLAPRRKLPAFSRAFAEHTGLMAADAVWVLEVRGHDAVSSMHLLAGPAEPATAAEVAPASLRAVYGSSAIMNAVHVSASTADAERELAFCFDAARKQPCVHDNCAVVIVKPHALAAGALGAVLQSLLGADLEVSGARTLALSRADATAYLSAYKGVVPEYSDWVAGLTAGPAVALQVRGQDIVTTLRALVGPFDPQIARALRPASLRAEHGVDSVDNGLHVTDLPTDGPLESQFLFETVRA